MLMNYLSQAEENGRNERQEPSRDSTFRRQILRIGR